jgi:2-methylfumaryl-CoA isomerase
MPGLPLDFAAAPREPTRPAPLLGEHTDLVLSQVLGMPAAEIGRLHDAGIAAGPERRKI